MCSQILLYYTISNFKNLFYDVPLHWTIINITDIIYKSKYLKYFNDIIISKVIEK